MVLLKLDQLLIRVLVVQARFLDKGGHPYNRENANKTVGGLARIHPA